MAVPSQGHTVWALQELPEVLADPFAAHLRPGELGVGHERCGVLVGCGESLVHVQEKRMHLHTASQGILKEPDVGLEPAAGSDGLEEGFRISAFLAFR